MGLGFSREHKESNDSDSLGLFHYESESDDRSIFAKSHND